MKMLSSRQLCEEIGIHRATLDRWRKRPGFPVGVRVGLRAVRFRVEDVERWLAERAEASEVEAQG